MKKSIVSPKVSPVDELEPFDPRKIDPAKFKPDLSAKGLSDIIKYEVEHVRLPTFFIPIERLSVTKTVGLGRTNLTFIRPTIVQTDATTPYAAFDRTLSPTRNPAISMHFKPSAYGITSVSTYVMVFSIQAFGSVSFKLSGFPGSGTLSNAGPKTFNSAVGVSLVFHNVQPSHEIWGALEQTAGGTWHFFNALVRFPYPLILVP